GGCNSQGPVFVCWGEPLVAVSTSARPAFFCPALHFRRTPTSRTRERTLTIWRSRRWAGVFKAVWQSTGGRHFVWKGRAAIFPSTSLRRPRDCARFRGMELWAGHCERLVFSRAKVFATR